MYLGLSLARMRLMDSGISGQRLEHSDGGFRGKKKKKEKRKIKYRSPPRN
jgi:hypothetical protein